MVTKNICLFETMRGQIDEISEIPTESLKIEKMLHEAHVQSKDKEVMPKRRRNRLKRYMVLWRNRFYYGIHWKKPLYPLRLARNVILGKFYNFFGIKKFVLRGIEFAVTYRCNFRCNHCLCSRIEESEKRKEMVPNDYARVVESAMKLGCITFGIEGGEPFVSSIWEEIIKACKPKYNHIIISTNGYLFNLKKARKCAELGVDTINFSLDSGYREIHDLFRRKRGSFEKVVEGIELCRKFGIKVIINTVVHKGNLYTEHFRELLEMCERERILVNTLFAKGVGNFKGKDVLLDEEDMKAYEKIIAPYNYVQRHLNYNYGKQFGCPGTKEMINMTPYGDVLNCANMHIYFGNVLEEPLKVIRDRALSKTPFGRYHSCFLADDRDFMKVYYSLLDKKKSVSISEFSLALHKYERENNKQLYSDHQQNKLAARSLLGVIR